MCRAQWHCSTNIHWSFGHWASLRRWHVLKGIHFTCPFKFFLWLCPCFKNINTKLKQKKVCLDTWKNIGSSATCIWKLHVFGIHSQIQFSPALHLTFETVEKQKRFTQGMSADEIIYCNDKTWRPQWNVYNRKNVMKWYNRHCWNMKQEVHGPWRSAWHLQLVWQMAIFCRLIS